jgi:hypothetical protein
MWKEEYMYEYCRNGSTSFAFLKVKVTSCYITFCCALQNYFNLRRVNKFQVRQTAVDFNYINFLRFVKYSKGKGKVAPLQARLWPREG